MVNIEKACKVYFMRQRESRLFYGIEATLLKELEKELFSAREESPYILLHRDNIFC